MQNIATGIDVGTHHVKVVIAQHSGDTRQPPRILGTGYATSIGMRRGYCIAPQETARAVRAAAAQAQAAARVKIKNCYLAVGGEGLDEAFSRGEAVVERGDSAVTSRDMDKALDASQRALAPGAKLNRRILHTVPLSWTLDGAKVLGKSPAGMKGQRIAVETLFVTAPERHIDDLVDAIEEAGIGVENTVAAPLAAGHVMLSKMQQRVGCVLAIIGAETVSAAVFEEDGPISIKVFPMGAADIAADLALGLKIPLEEAEQLKMGAVLGAPFSRKKIDDIINRRLGAMFKLIEAHLKKIGRDGLLPAGAVLTGGGASVANMCDVAQAALSLPCRLGSIAAGEAGKTQLHGGSWAISYGLACLALGEGETEPRERGSLRAAFSDTFGGTWKFLKKFLP